MNHIALIFGGPSAEHDVSLVSAKNIFEVLEQTQLKTSLLAVTKDKTWKLIKGEDLKKTNFVKPIDVSQIGITVRLVQENNQIFIQSSESSEKIGPVDAAFPIIHGPYGEDGQLQAELNEISFEFIGSDVEGCYNSFDKAVTKEIISRNNIPQAPYLVFVDENPFFANVKSQLGLPFFVKPANMGSSIGISKVSKEEDFMKAIAEARIHDKKIIIEKGIVGREIECALLEGAELMVSGLGEIKPNHEFYSYEAKYLDPNGADLLIPAIVDPVATEKVRNTALKAFKALGCRDYVRADFFLTADGEVYFNEINTHPGFTNISQFPMLWKQEGMTYKELILHLVHRALKRRTDR